MATSSKTAAKKPTAPAKTSAKKTAAPAKAVMKKPVAPAKAAAPKVAKTDPPAVAEKKAAPKSTAPGRKATIPPERRRNYIEVAAYFIAERHGFTPGRALEDWAAAEDEIDRLLAEGRINP